MICLPFRFHCDIQQNMIALARFSASKQSSINPKTQTQMYVQTEDFEVFTEVIILTLQSETYRTIGKMLIFRHIRQNIIMPTIEPACVCAEAKKEKYKSCTQIASDCLLTLL